MTTFLIFLKIQHLEPQKGESIGRFVPTTCGGEEVRPLEQVGGKDLKAAPKLPPEGLAGQQMAGSWRP